MLHAIVPVKSLALAKSRLSEMLDPSERRALALAMLEDVLRLLQATPVVTRFGVVSRDTSVLRVAQQMGADRLLDQSTDLNGALTQAASQYTQAGAQALLILHADLPLVTPDELGHMAAKLATPNDIALAPARDAGTNALACIAPHPIPFLFGGRSLERHVHAAREQRLTPHLIRSRGLERDIDRPEDLIWLLETPGHTNAQQFVRQLGILERAACV
jgi:2-phospho-L-lactate guanylyltransferase